MKRYTLRVRALDSSVTVDRLRSVIDENLIRLHPRITYHLGKVISTNSPSMLAEIGADGSKELIASHLKKLEEQMPVVMESLAWGWSTNDDTIPEISHSLKQDPLATVNPGIGQVTFELSKKTLVLRYLLVLGLTVALISLLVAKFYLDRSLALDMTHMIVLMMWLFSLNEIPLDIRRYAAKIECNPSNIRITYVISNKVELIDWQTIWGMEYNHQACRLFNNEKTERFLLNVNGGRNETKIMLKTIVERASLNFVETNFLKTVYKRYDAPDEKR